jgi:hypothetical protein
MRFLWRVRLAERQQDNYRGEHLQGYKRVMDSGSRKELSFIPFRRLIGLSPRSLARGGLLTLGLVLVTASSTVAFVVWLHEGRERAGIPTAADLRHVQREGSARGETIRGVEIEVLQSDPVSLSSALRMIDEGRVAQIVLQPDRQPNGAPRWYERPAAAGGYKRWELRGVDVVFFTYPETPDEFLLHQRPVLSETEDYIGVSSGTLSDIIGRVLVHNQTSESAIRVIDDRDWWAAGKPVPHDDQVIIP